jgi:hypothetical protein
VNAGTLADSTEKYYKTSMGAKIVSNSKKDKTPKQKIQEGIALAIAFLFASLFLYYIQTI